MSEPEQPNQEPQDPLAALSHDVDDALGPPRERGHEIYRHYTPRFRRHDSDVTVRSSK